MSTTTAEASATLLREWSYPRDAIAPEALPETVESVPPVAPAVIVNEEESSPTKFFSQPYSYPVASFVNNLVRQASHTIDHFHSSVSELAACPNQEQQQQQQQQTQAQHLEDDVPLSVRSEFPAAALAVDTTSTEFTTRSAPPAVGDQHPTSPDENDYILVDGDLIDAPQHYYYEEAVERMEAKRACRLKRFKKWVKKRVSRSPKSSDGKPQKTRTRKHKKRNRNRTASSEIVFEELPQSAEHEQQQLQRQQLEAPSIQQASLVGNAVYEENGEISTRSMADTDLVYEECAVAAAYIEAEADDKLDDVLYSTTPRIDAPKVDPLHEHLAEACREEESSEHESYSSLMHSSPHIAARPQQIPLSRTTSLSTDDQEVYNDTLKLFMVGAPGVGKSTLVRKLRHKSPHKKGRRCTSDRMSVSVHDWTATVGIEQQQSVPTTSNSTTAMLKDDNRKVRFSVWDINEGITSGTHPATQSVFFSSDSMYVLVWDMAWYNEKTHRKRSRGYYSEESSDDDDDYDDQDDYVLEESNRQADLALETDIQERVLKWVDQIASTCSNCAVLPVANIPEGMDEFEAQRRCSMMQALLIQHVQGNTKSPKLVGDDVVLQIRVNSDGDELEEAVLSAIHQEQTLFSHVGSPVPRAVVEVLNTARRLKKEEGHRVVLVEQIAVEVGLPLEEVTKALRFLSNVGELLYFGGGSKSKLLSQYVVLSHKWLVSALSCILRNDLKRELDDVRLFMNMQGEYGGKQYIEDDVSRTLLKGCNNFNKGSNSHCPILSSSDAAMLWAERDFMRAAANRTAEINPNTESDSMFKYLEELLVFSGILLPLNVPTETKEQRVFFVPSLVPQASPDIEQNIWTYKSNESYLTTLCHSWLLRDGAPSNMMESITVSLIEDLYEFAKCVRPAPKAIHRAKTYPMDASRSDASLTQEEETIESIKIRQVMCWDSSFLVTIGYIYQNSKTGEYRESTAEVYVALVDQSSNHCVASSAMHGGMKRLIVCGKGQIGHHGRKLWKGGYGLVLDSIKASMANLAMVNVDRQVVCPDCLAQSHPSMASTWSWDDVRAENERGYSSVVCMRGHRIETNLVCGTCKSKDEPKGIHHSIAPRVPVSSLSGSVVVVALWDKDSQSIQQVGSGFVVDRKQGLIVTAAHTLFDMRKGKHFGRAYHGLKNAKALIGVIPTVDGTAAVFRYTAEIVAHDVSNMDACVLRIISKFDQDVTCDGDECGHEPEILFKNNASALEGEDLQQLKLTKRFVLEEAIRVLGFNQGGEGLLQEGSHVNRYIDVARGYVCKTYKPLPDDSSDSSLSSGQMELLTNNAYIPREEIVAMCPTINGHSGGPCVNGEGRVIGIVSRADSTDSQRCYLVPSSELKKLVARAKKGCLQSR